MTASAASIRTASASEVLALSAELAEVLIDCVDGGASVGFLAPLPAARAKAFWRGVAQSVEKRQRVIVLAQGQGGQVVGAVQLVLEQPDNQSHRADVCKLLVHTAARRHGLGAALMAAVEMLAWNAGRKLLVLDTATGSDAECLYARTGWTRAGVIPNYSRLSDGRLCSTSYFYKSSPETAADTALHAVSP